MNDIPNKKFKPYMEAMKQALPKATTNQIINVLQLINLMSGYEVIHKDKYKPVLEVVDEEQNFDRMVNRFLSDIKYYGRLIRGYSKDKHNIDWYVF